MHLNSRLLLVLATVFCSTSTQAAADWSRIKAGITQAEAEAALGQPIIRTYGRGFEVWIYDSQGEIIFAGGPALGWTQPVTNVASAARPIENDVLIRPMRRLPAMRSTIPPVNPVVDASELRFRYK